MKYLVQRLGGRRLFILGSAILMFLVAVVVNQFIISSTSSPYYARLIQREVIQKEKDFQKMAEDTALLHSLISKTYDEETLNSIVDDKKGYLFFIYGKDTGTESKLLFWNSHQALPPINIMNESDASRMVRLNNGLYVHTSKRVNLFGSRALSVEGLIPVMWKYFVEIENLQKEFAFHPEAGKRVDITFNPTVYPIKSSYGNILFYLEKTTGEPQEMSWIARIFMLMGVFLLIIYVHQTAQYISQRFNLLAAIGFLATMIVAMRLFTYYYPVLLDLRALEL